jgi:TATA-box binding protein (TBP) (component of TFIID and TFIIIB)
MTGSKTVLDGYSIVDKIVKEVLDKPACSIASYRIFMMNISLKLITDYLDLDVLYDRFKRNNTSCYYDKNKHAALKIKFSKMSILIFSSGSILIMGNKSTYDIKTMLEWLKENLIS